MTKHTLRQDGRPSIQFYPDDWISSPDLSSCSLAAQGLWMRMICYMFYSPKRGVLLLSSGKQIESKMLAKLVGEDEQIVSKLLNELETAGVFSRLDTQGIICRRMYREAQLSLIRSEAGRKGGLKAKSKQVVEEEDEEEVEDVLKNKDSNINIPVKDKLPEKEKPTKEKFLEFVLLTVEEHKKLTERLGETKTNTMIERLNNYIGSSGRRYKSHYHTILNWINKDEKEGKFNEQQTEPGKYSKVPIIRAEDM
jgi:hypothetical protein